jgi:hypothetical protein
MKMACTALDFQLIHHRNVLVLWQKYVHNWLTNFLQLSSQIFPFVDTFFKATAAWDFLPWDFFFIKQSPFRNKSVSHKASYLPGKSIHKSPKIGSLGFNATSGSDFFFVRFPHSLVPHCVIALTKAAARGWKEPLLPHLLHSPVFFFLGGGGFLWSPADLLK